MDALNPSAIILAKLGSAVVHCQEFFSEDSHEFDHVALMTLLNDAEVIEWLEVGRWLRHEKTLHGRG